MRLLRGRRMLSGGAECCAVLCMVGAAAVGIQLSPGVQGGESYLLARTAIMAAPLAVSACCVAAFRAYGGSRVFGRSFLLLGAGYGAVFAGEALYYFHLDPTDTQDIWEGVAEALFLAAYPLFAAHVIVNLSYFTGRVGRRGLLPTAASAVAAAGYAGWVGIDTAGAWTGVVAVAGSFALLGVVVLAFAAFRRTALSSPWGLLLAGVSLGTVGDILYRYADATNSYWFGDPSTGFWLASYMVVAYALYRHYVSI